MISTSSPLLDIAGLSLSVTSGESSKRILSDVSLQCAPGEFIALVGESGSGKSMTLRTIVGLTPTGAVTSGRVTVDGLDILTAPKAEILKLRRNRVAMIFQDPRAHINPYQTIGEFLSEGLRINQGIGKSRALKIAANLLDEVGLVNPVSQLRKHPHELSGGMLQRVMIASALSSEPEILLADEPTTALDVTTQAEIISILQELRARRGLTIIMVTHDLDLAAGSCDRISVMRFGEIVETAPARELWLSPQHRYTQMLLAAMPSRLPRVSVDTITHSEEAAS